ncbi:MAG: HAMP domain-containing histidine kinase [Pseudonocardia sp.]|nr:HAMP domain-containing histidine kinase [Pseudonocardia sp.]
MRFALDPARLPLRRRVGLSLALVSTLITGLLAAITWNLASGYLIDQREQTATRQVGVDARLVEAALGSSGTPDNLEGLLTGLAGSPATTIALRREDSWTTAGRAFDVDRLPDRLLELARSGNGGRQRIDAAGMPALAVALPLRGPGAVYVELVPLAELDRTLRFLSAVLLIGVGASALLGLGLGYWVGRRALRPLTELTDAASRVAGGDLRARLPEVGDADLAPLAVTFNRTTDSLAARVRRDARFAADVSHELRSPLTTLLNAVAVLDRRRHELPEPAAQAVALLVADLHRFRRMVTDLLEISRTDAGGGDGDFEVCDLADLVRRSIAERRDTVPVRVQGDPPRVLVDRRRLDRVLGNLLDNADSHGGGTVLVTVAGRPGGVRLQVDDAGPGVPPELREEIFERFARGDAAGRRGDDGGSGLGLALVARHVRDHNGRVHIEERPGGGARVIVDIPEVEP